MSDNQLQYRINSKCSIAMCNELEQLVEYADYCEKMLNYHSLEITVLRYNQVKLELDVIWDEQVDLFFKIQDEYKDNKKAAVLASLK